MLNSKVLRHCKQAVRIVNVARGLLIDENALLKGLLDGRVHSVVLDVFELEPLPNEF